MRVTRSRGPSVEEKIPSKTPEPSLDLKTKAARSTRSNVAVFEPMMTRSRKSLSTETKERGSIKPAPQSVTPTSKVRRGRPRKESKSASKAKTAIPSRRQDKENESNAMNKWVKKGTREDDDDFEDFEVIQASSLTTQTISSPSSNLNSSTLVDNSLTTTTTTTPTSLPGSLSSPTLSTPTTPFISNINPSFTQQVLTTPIHNNHFSSSSFDDSPFFPDSTKKPNPGEDSPLVYIDSSLLGGTTPEPVVTTQTQQQLPAPPLALDGSVKLTRTKSGTKKSSTDNVDDGFVEATDEIFAQAFEDVVSQAELTSVTELDLSNDSSNNHQNDSQTTLSSDDISDQDEKTTKGSRKGRRKSSNKQATPPLPTRTQSKRRAAVAANAAINAMLVSPKQQGSRSRGRTSTTPGSTKKKRDSISSEPEKKKIQTKVVRVESSNPTPPINTTATTTASEMKSKGIPTGSRIGSLPEKFGVISEKVIECPPSSVNPSDISTSLSSLKSDDLPPIPLPLSTLLQQTKKQSVGSTTIASTTSSRLATNTNSAMVVNPGSTSTTSTSTTFVNPSNNKMMIVNNDEKQKSIIPRLARRSSIEPLPIPTSQSITKTPPLQAAENSTIPESLNLSSVHKRKELEKELENKVPRKSSGTNIISPIAKRMTVRASPPLSRNSNTIIQPDIKELSPPRPPTPQLPNTHDPPSSWSPNSKPDFGYRSTRYSPPNLNTVNNSNHPSRHSTVTTSSNTLHQRRSVSFASKPTLYSPPEMAPSSPLLASPNPSSSPNLSPPTRGSNNPLPTPAKIDSVDLTTPMKRTGTSPMDTPCPPISPFQLPPSESSPTEQLPGEDIERRASLRSAPGTPMIAAPTTNTTTTATTLIRGQYTRHSQAYSTDPSFKKLSVLLKAASPPSSRRTSPTGSSSNIISKDDSTSSPPPSEDASLKGPMLFAEKPELVCSKKLCEMLLVSKELNKGIGVDIKEGQESVVESSYDAKPLSLTPYITKISKEKNRVSKVYIPKFNPTPDDDNDDEEATKRTNSHTTTTTTRSMASPKLSKADYELIKRRHSYIPAKKDRVVSSDSNGRKSQTNSPEIIMKNGTKKQITSTNNRQSQQSTSPKIRQEQKTLSPVKRKPATARSYAKITISLIALGLLFLVLVFYFRTLIEFVESNLL